MAMKAWTKQLLFRYLWRLFLIFFANSMCETWDCNGKWGFFSEQQVVGRGPSAWKTSALLLGAGFVSYLVCYLRRRRNFQQSFSLSGAFGFRGWCSKYFCETNSRLLVQNLTLHCSMQILLHEGCKVLAPGEELTQSCSRGSLRFWALKDKKRARKFYI